MEKPNKMQKMSGRFTKVGLIFSICLIIVLIIALKVVNKRLENLADLLDTTVEQHITSDVILNTSLPLNSSFQIKEELSVGINMMVETVIPLNVEIPVDQKIFIPFKIGVKDYIKLDTTIMITDDVFATVIDTLYLDQKFTMPTSEKRGINVPVKASIPLNERVKININEAIPVYSIVPIDLLIVDTLPVGLDIKVPVNIKVPVSIPISTSAKVSFPDNIPVSGTIPISLIIPVDIPFSDTDLAPYILNISKGLRGLVKVKNSSSKRTNKEITKKEIL